MFDFKTKYCLFFLLKFLNKIFVLKFFDSQKKILVFIKSFVEKKNSLRKKEKKIDPTLFPTTHPTPPKK